MKDLLRWLLLVTFLAILTAGLGWMGLEWDGEVDSSRWYAYLGVPFLAGLIALGGAEVPIPVALPLAFALQWVCCLLLVGVPWGLSRLLRRLGNR